jgi:hypothetical protein
MGQPKKYLNLIFLAELVRICESETLHMLVGGDLVILISFDERRRKITIISMYVGLSFLMPSWRVLIYERSFFPIGSLCGLVGERFPSMRS